jgi:AcrR family transcriptional regulator
MMSSRSNAPEERRTQIVEAALTLFTHQGYNNTTMDDIVAESGLSKGTLYWYFESKDDLFNAAMMSVFEDTGQEVLAVVSECSTAAGKLRAMAQAAIHIAKQTDGLFNLFLEFWTSSSRREEASQLWLDLLEEYRSLTAAIIQEGIDNGEFAPVAAEHLVWAVLAAYDGLAAYITLKPDLELEQINTAFVDTLLIGLLTDAEQE